MAKTWSWDARRMGIITRKRTLMDCVVDGDIPTRDPEQDLKDTWRAWSEWMERLEDGNVIKEEGLRPLQAPVIETPEMRQARAMTEWNVLNRLWSSTDAARLHERLAQDPSQWQTYHRHLGVLRESWEEIPAVYIASQIAARPDWIVGDFGCGECLLSDALPKNRVISYDHVAFDDRVTVANIACVPAEDQTFDAVVMSCSMSGTKANRASYLAEVYRTLKARGTLFLAEPEGRCPTQAQWDAHVKDIEEVGFIVLRSSLRYGFWQLEVMKVG